MNEKGDFRSKSAEAIIKKVQALLALSTSSNEAEASQAANKAQEMLALYNLTMEDVRRANPDNGPSDFDKIVFATMGYNTDSRPWRRPLATEIGRLYFCKYFYTFDYDTESAHAKKRKCGYIRYDKHTFVGTNANTNVAMMMFDYLNKTVERLSKEASKSRPAKGQAAFINSFRQGCVNRLSSRLAERYWKAREGKIETEVGGTNLPALRNVFDRHAEANDAAVKAAFGALGKSRKKPTKAKMSDDNREGIIAGSKAGDTISLDTQITKQKSEKINHSLKLLSGRKYKTQPLENDTRGKWMAYFEDAMLICGYGGTEVEAIRNLASAKE